MRAVVALIVILGLSACDLVYFHYSDCRYYDGPRFDRVSLLRPVLNQAYFDYVRVYFDEDPHIADYYYRFEFSGRLPPGMSYYQDRRTVYVEGAAISQGAYSFTVAVEARYEIHDRHYYYYDSHCRYRTARTFLLIVDPV